MIRFLQQDTKAIKFIFASIIGIVIVGMVWYLVLPLLGNTNNSQNASVYATVREPGILGRIGFGESTEIKMEDVTKLAQRQLQQQHYPDFLLPYMMQQAGQYLVQQAIKKQAADAMHLEVSDADLVRELRTGPFAEYLFPNGQFVGDDKYIDFLQAEYGSEMTRSYFEQQVKEEMELQRLQAMVTGGATVTDAAVREAYRVQGMKVQFDYAAVSL
ncbi:MAG: SurA N-terminal domain-containing protein, partial [Acidobacteriaceae bacterium]